MPSPVGHVLGGLVFGWAVAGAPAAPAADASGPSAFRRAVARLGTVLSNPWSIGFGLLGALADLDLLLGIHSRQTHSLGAIAGVFVVATVWGGRLDPRRGLACAVAYGSHVLFDWLGSDVTPPIGIMALWPFTRDFYQSNLHVFAAIHRQYWLPGAWTHNVLAVAREVVLLAPLCWLVWWWRRLRTAAGEARQWPAVSPAVRR
jgi:inner membrane protein